VVNTTASWAVRFAASAILKERLGRVPERDREIRGEREGKNDRIEEMEQMIGGFKEILLWFVSDFGEDETGGFKQILLWFISVLAEDGQVVC
jgi:hypothetical protein